IECRLNKAKVKTNAHHDENVISTWQVQRLLYQFESVLRQLNTGLKTGKGKLCEVEIFSRQDKETVWKWNNNKLNVVNRCIHNLFEQLAVSQPEAQAVH